MKFFENLRVSKLGVEHVFSSSRSRLADSRGSKSLMVKHREKGPEKSYSFDVAALQLVLRWRCNPSRTCSATETSNADVLGTPKKRA